MNIIAKLNPGQRYRPNDDGTVDVEFPCGWYRMGYAGRGVSAFPTTMPTDGIRAIEDNPWPADAGFQRGAYVEKKGRAKWRGRIVGWYRTELTALGYAVESHFEPGSVQIYPETALVAWNAEAA